MGEAVFSKKEYKWMICIPLFLPFVTAAIVRYQLKQLHTKLQVLCDQLSQTMSKKVFTSRIKTKAIYKTMAELVKKLINQKPAAKIVLNYYPIFQIWEEKLNCSSNDYFFLHNNYVYFNSSLIKGISWWKKSKDLVHAYKDKNYSFITRDYKIHLMPCAADDLLHIVHEFIQALRSNQKLQKSINGFKFKLPQYHELLEQQLLNTKNELLPIIVIYPVAGKEYAQYVLDILYQLFGTMEGLNMTPRYNAQVTSLIYYAQGDGSLKTKYPHYFTDDKIFFKPTIEGRGTINYRLKNPVQ